MRFIVKGLKKLFLIINIKTLIITLLAVLSTFFCAKYDLVADFPLTLIGTSIIFPIVFSIGGAYKRREVALDDYGNIKAHGRALHFAARDWLGEHNEEAITQLSDLLEKLLQTLRTMFSEPVKKMRENEKDVYNAFSNLSVFIKEQLRNNGLASGEVSRCNQFLSKMMISFEQIKHVYQYRTPRTLRTFSNVFISILPVVYGPYFAYISKDYSKGLEFVIPVLFSVILVSLDNIQSHLENPFDQIGEDDITINAEKFKENLYV